MDEAGLVSFMNSHSAHKAEILAANGIGDARSLAKLYAHVIGEVDGMSRFLTEETLKTATVPQTDDMPLPSPFDLLVPPGSLRFALGFEKNRSGMPILGESSFGHSGVGGRLHSIRRYRIRNYGRICVQ